MVTVGGCACKGCEWLVPNLVKESVWGSGARLVDILLCALL